MRLRMSDHLGDNGVSSKFVILSGAQRSRMTFWLAATKRGSFDTAAVA